MATGERLKQRNAAALDTNVVRPYSLPFRTWGSEDKSNVQLVLSVWRRCSAKR